MKANLKQAKQNAILQANQSAFRLVTGVLFSLSYKKVTTAHHLVYMYIKCI